MTSLRRCALAASLWAVALLMPAAPTALWTATASAQPESGQGENSFRQVSGPQQEDVPGGSLLIGAYAVIWLLVLGYVGRLGMLQAATRRDLERVEKTLADTKGSR